MAGWSGSPRIGAALGPDALHAILAGGAWSHPLGTGLDEAALEGAFRALRQTAGPRGARCTSPLGRREAEDEA